MDTGVGAPDRGPTRARPYPHREQRLSRLSAWSTPRCATVLFRGTSSHGFPRRSVARRAGVVIDVGKQSQRGDRAAQAAGGEFELDGLRDVHRLGLQAEFVKTPFSQAFVGLAAGKYRLNASNIFIRCERIGGPGQLGHFTVPTFDVGLSIATRTDRPAAARSPS